MGKTRPQTRGATVFKELSNGAGSKPPRVALLLPPEKKKMVPASLQEGDNRKMKKGGGGFDNWAKSNNQRENNKGGKGKEEMCQRGEKCPNKWGRGVAENKNTMGAGGQGGKVGSDWKQKRKIGQKTKRWVHELHRPPRGTR